jgi:hypothetical protein
MNNQEIKQTLENSPKLRKDLKIAKLNNKNNIAILETECKMIEFQIKDKLNFEMEKDKTKYSNSEKRDVFIKSELVKHEQYQVNLKNIDELKSQMDMQDIELSYSLQLFESCLAFCYAGKEFLQ